MGVDRASVRELLGFLSTSRYRKGMRYRVAKRMLIQLEGDRIAVEPHPETQSEYKEFFEADVVPGAVLYMKRGGVETAVNTGQKPWRELCIEFKDEK